MPWSATIAGKLIIGNKRAVSADNLQKRTPFPLQSSITLAMHHD
jgi:hypothetical protein